MILLRATTWTLSIWSHMDQAYQNGAKPSMKLYISVFILNIYLPGTYTYAKSPKSKRLIRESTICNL